MYAILHGANGRRHEVDFGDDPVVVNVAMSDITVQITTTALGDPDPDRAQFVTVTVPREQLVAAMAEAVNRPSKAGDASGMDYRRGKLIGSQGSATQRLWVPTAAFALVARAA